MHDTRGSLRLARRTAAAPDSQIRQHANLAERHLAVLILRDWAVRCPGRTHYFGHRVPKNPQAQRRAPGYPHASCAQRKFAFTSDLDNFGQSSCHPLLVVRQSAVASFVDRRQQAGDPFLYMAACAAPMCAAWERDDRTRFVRSTPFRYNWKDNITDRNMTARTKSRIETWAPMIIAVAALGFSITEAHRNR